LDKEMSVMAAVRVGLEDFRKYLTELIAVGDEVEVTSYGRVVAVLRPVPVGEREERHVRLKGRRELK
jgi:antitoxin (DNA-binding transcriptional repressor) of toxin-antitoxin stability system